MRRGRSHLAAYIGVMGPQDGVDIVLMVADTIVHRWKRTDIAFTLIGSGDCFDELVTMREQLRLEDYVELTGRVPDKMVAVDPVHRRCGYIPRPKEPTKRPLHHEQDDGVYGFRPPRRSFRPSRDTECQAGGAALYAKPNEVEEMARLLVELVDDEARRRSMGAIGRARVEQELAWPIRPPVI